jgi:hypothetical protein
MNDELKSSHGRFLACVCLAKSNGFYVFTGQTGNCRGTNPELRIECPLLGTGTNPTNNKPGADVHDEDIVKIESAHCLLYP